MTALQRGERVHGVLFGLAAGDRIGGPIRMALRLAESLAELGGYDAADVARRYLAWWRDEGFDTGPTAGAVFASVAGATSGVSTADFELAAARVDALSGGLTAGCNPAHRSAPLAMCAGIPDDDLARAAIADARLTHRHPLAGDVAAAVVRLCRALIRGDSWPQALAFASARRDARTQAALFVDEDGALNREGFAPDVLAAAVYFVGRAGSFADALSAAIDFAGPANYCPVLVGSIGGARWGRTAVEDALVAHHREILPAIATIARRLSAPWSRSP